MIDDVRPDLLPTDDELAAAGQAIEAAYGDYVTNVSTPGMAIARQAIVYIQFLLTKFKPARVADFGSGFTSYVLARYVQEHGGTVVSVDDSQEWLDATASFLKKWDVPPGRLCLFDDFEPAEFDFIIYDYAGGEIRNAQYEFVTGLLAPGGAIYYDDAHHDGHRWAMHAACETRRMDLHGLYKWTADNMNRYGALGLLPGDGPFGTSIAGQYALACKTPSDISDQLPIMVEQALAIGAKRIVELGTRGGVSTVGWLHVAELTDGHVWSVDVDAAPELEHDRWTFVQGDDLDPATIRQLPRQADVVFIDTSHMYAHTRAELAVYRRRVRPGGKLILHDSFLERPEGWTRDQPPFPVRAAIDEFCTDEDLKATFYDVWPGLAVIDIPE